MIQVDVLVAGGGLGGIAATLAAADAGCRVLLAEPGDRIGGQVTAQAVSALDEHPHVELPGTTSATYAAFREGVRAWYRARYPAVRGVADLNPGSGWVSRLCFEPEAGRAVLDAMLAGHVDGGRVTVLTGAPVERVHRHGDRLAGAVLRAGGDAVEVRAAVVADATELGDLLPLAGAPWVTGIEARADTGEPDAAEIARPGAQQACTVALAVEHRPGEDHTIPRPPGYAALRDRQPFTLTLGGDGDVSRPFAMFRDGPTGLPPFWTYRRIRCGALLDPGGVTTDVVLFNWDGNDFAGAGLIGPGPGPDPAAVADARRLSLAFLHWLQTEVPRDDGSRGHRGLRPVPQATGTPDGLAAAPYVREARRLRARRRVRSTDLRPARPGDARARHTTDSGGIGWYAIDLHRRVGDAARTTRYAPTAPFQIPLSCLVAAVPRNLVAAAKNLGATHVANGALRVHHVEWAVGEAAGTLAAEAVAAGTDPSDLLTRPDGVARVQRRLVARGVPLCWFVDLPPWHPGFAGAHLLAAAGALEGDPARRDTLRARPGRALSADELAGLRAAAARSDLPDPAGARPASWGDACAAAAPPDMVGSSA